MLKGFGSFRVGDSDNDRTALLTTHDELSAGWLAIKTSHNVGVARHVKTETCMLAANAIINIDFIFCYIHTCT